MSQKLAIPVRKCTITADYKCEAYKNKYGYDHFGIDITSIDDKHLEVYACGNGTVIDCGLDGKNGPYSGLGYITIIRYDDVELCDGTIVDVICTTFHHEEGSILVRKGQTVNAETQIAKYGKTGTGIEGEHLHIQFSTDVDNPYNCTGISGVNSALLKSSNMDLTLNPITVLNNYDIGVYPDRIISDIFWSGGWVSDLWFEIGTIKDIQLGPVIDKPVDDENKNDDTGQCNGHDVFSNFIEDLAKILRKYKV